MTVPRSRAWARVGMLVLALAPCLWASDDGRKPILSVYSSRERAFAGKDYDALAALLAPDYTQEDSGAKLNRDDAIAALKREMKRASPPLRVKIKVAKLTIDAGTAACHVTETFSYHIKGNDHRMHRFRYIRESEERLRLINGQWLVASSVAQAARYWIDDKPADAARVHQTQGI